MEAGPDTVEGGTGADEAFGDERIIGDLPALCGNDTAPQPDPQENSTDKVSGGDGIDKVFGGAGPTTRCTADPAPTCCAATRVPT